LITGISLVMLSFAKRMVVKNLKDKIDSIR
jgi:hypothetical protein